MSKKLPNIILMVLDTVGAKHLSLFDYHRPTTQNLEKIAQESLVFNRCFAPAGWTVPSHASLFTGLYPSQHGAFENSYLLRDNLPHLGPILKALGYRTLGISTNSLVSPASGLCQGFDEFHDLGFRDFSRILAGLEGREVTEPAEPGSLAARLRTAVSTPDAARLMFRYLWETGQAGAVLQTSWKMGRKQAAKWLRPQPIDNTTPYTRKTVGLIREMVQSRGPSDPPFFLFANILQAHQNYCPPRRWRRFSRWHDRVAASPQKFYFQADSPGLARLVATYQNLYDDELRYLDGVLGQLWKIFANASLFDDTVVIITSDHGEHFGERGHYTHILSLYNELIWVPLIVRLPPSLARTGLDRRLVSLNDLYATILDLADSPWPRPETSFSLLAPPQRELAVSQCVYPEMWQTYLVAKQASSQSRGQTFSPPVFAVITEGGLKLIENRDGSVEVYDLRESLVETRDLAPTLSPERIGNYQNLLQTLQVETGFHEVTSAVLTMAAQQAA